MSLARVQVRSGEEIRPTVFRRRAEAPRGGPVCLLTIDLEQRQGSQLETTLDDLDRLGACGTFFVIPEETPAVVLRAVWGRGHELACLGRSKPSSGECTPDRFRRDAREAKMRLEDALGTAVAGYRAPRFSMGRRTLYGLCILTEEGFQFDSSIDGQFERSPWRAPVIVQTDSGNILEAPVTARRMFGLNVPCGGGRSWRALPSCVAERWVRRFWGETHLPAMIAAEPGDLRSPRFTRLAQSFALTSIEAGLLTADLEHVVPGIEVRSTESNWVRKLLYDPDSY